jgi:hypothetical protein
VVSCSRDAPSGASAVFRAVLYTYLSIYLGTYFSVVMWARVRTHTHTNTHTHTRMGY